jgi:hypothetical protein
MTYSRVDESRERVRAMLNAALGVYIKAEPKQRDEWREKTIWDAYEHLRHELEEVHRAKTLEGKLHNALDCVGQSAILAATVQEEIERRENKDNAKL